MVSEVLTECGGVGGCAVGLVITALKIGVRINLIVGGRLFVTIHRALTAHQPFGGYVRVGTENALGEWKGGLSSSI